MPRLAYLRNISMPLLLLASY